MKYIQEFTQNWVETLKKTLYPTYGEENSVYTKMPFQETAGPEITMLSISLYGTFLHVLSEVVQSMNIYHQ